MFYVRYAIFMPIWIGLDEWRETAKFKGNDFAYAVKLGNNGSSRLVKLAETWSDFSDSCSLTVNR